MEKIIRVVDRYFAFMDELDGNSFLEELIPESMLNRNKSSIYEGIKHWISIKSTITNNEIAELESHYNCRFPDSYKYFLKHRHFIELDIGAYAISFFKNLPNTFVEDTKEEIANFYNILPERKYFPFAREGDFGVLCFDMNEQVENHDYKIVRFEHVDLEAKPKKYSENFITMFDEFESHLEEWIKSKKAK